MGTCLLQSVSSRFNTASSKYCCNCLSQLQRPNHEALGFNTASGKYCCNFREFLFLYWRRRTVSITQAVSTVATVTGLPEYQEGTYYVSIPQAVSTVATFAKSIPPGYVWRNCFNTASGKYCCNFVDIVNSKMFLNGLSFNTASGKYCCNI